MRYSADGGVIPGWDGHLPKSNTELAGLVILGLVVMVLAQAAAGGWILRRHMANDNDARADRTELKETAAAIKGQVVNGHTEPLRADLDRLKQDMAAILKRLDQWAPTIGVVRALTDDVKGLRADVAEERASRRELAADVRADMARNRDEVTDLHRRIRDASS